MFTTQPGTGHLHPLLPVARGLRDAGHDVAVAASGPMAPEVVGAGFDHHPVGSPWLTTDMPRRFPALASIPPGPERYAWGRRHVFAHETALDVVPDLLRLATAWKPDAIVRDAAEYGGYIAAEILGIPHAVVRTDSGSSSYADRGHVAGALDQVRDHFGLPPDPTADGPFRHLLLSFAPPGLDEEPPAPTCVQLRPPRHDCGAMVPDVLGRLTRRAPLVYATLGTVYNSAELLAAIVEALADDPIELVVTTGGRPLPGPFPPNVHVESWIPQDALLACCAAVVTHAGYGTVSAALGHGRPMVMVPISADQPMNARRIAAAGAGITLDAGDRTPGAIRAATRAVLDDVTYRDAARRLADEAACRPGVTDAVGLLEQLAVATAQAR
jgi:UDP:flavonoid glycosyltransferase YjiC (YdhE family)